jgi:hypothetical protein
MSIRSDLLAQALTCKALTWTTDDLRLISALQDRWEEAADLADGLDDDPILAPEAWLEGCAYHIEMAR